MKYKKTSIQKMLFFLGACLFFILFSSGISAQDEAQMSDAALEGMALFQGEKSFENGGPSCITCHNITNDNVMPGGLYAKDLTDVYERFGIGLSAWLQAPDPPAMSASYNFSPLESGERENLAAFFKAAYDTKNSQAVKSGYLYIFGGVSIGLFVFLLLIQLIWSNRKKKMVKADIFSRQNKAWDAKF